MKNLLVLYGPVHYKYRAIEYKVEYDNTYNEVLANNHFISAEYLKVLSGKL